MADFDAIVVGSGLSGGWVAKELCERGLKVLVLDRGDNVEPAKDYSDMLEPWQKPHLDQVSPEVMQSDFSIQGGNYALKASNKHLWMTDSDQPYEAVGGKFKWRRGSTIGGKSLMWGRASYRLAPYDFEVNKIDGEGVDWPVRYKDIAPWYDRVEKFVGIAGDRDGMAQFNTLDRRTARSWTRSMPSPQPLFSWLHLRCLFFVCLGDAAGSQKNGQYDACTKFNRHGTCL